MDVGSSSVFCGVVGLFGLFEWLSYSTQLET